jgi:hypothetical protein
MRYGLVSNRFGMDVVLEHALQDVSVWRRRRDLAVGERRMYRMSNNYV